MKPVSMSAQVDFENSSTLGTSVEGRVESGHLKFRLKISAIVQKSSEVFTLLM
jgi:riboflavin synthase alpha subunit